MNWLRKIPSVFFFFGALSVLSYLWPIWLYEHFEFPDGFSYLGEIISPVVQRLQFSNQPAGDLLPAIWPKHALYVLFPPLLANALSRILVTSLVLDMVFKIATKLFDSNFGFIALILTAANPYFWMIMGSDYPEAMAILYLTMALFFAEKSAREARVFSLVCFGGAICLSLSTAFLSVGYFAGVAVFYFALKRIHRAEILRRKDLWIAFGFAVTLLVLCAGHKWYAGTWIYFRQTVSKASSFLDVDRTPGGILQWIAHGKWLAFSLLLILYCFFRFAVFLPVVFRPASRQYKLEVKSWALVSGVSVLGFLYLTYLQVVRHQGTISDPFYFYQLLTYNALGLTAIFYRQFRSEITANRLLFFSLGAVALILGFAGPYVIFRICFALCAFCLLLSLFLQAHSRKLRTALVVVMWSATLIASENLTADFRADGRLRFDSFDLTDPVSGGVETISPLGKVSFLSTVAWIRLVDQIDPRREALLWYDKNEKLGKSIVNFSAATHFWQARLVNQLFPEVDPPPTGWRGPIQTEVRDGLELLILSDRLSAQLSKMTEGLRAKGLTYEVLIKTEFVSPPIRFEILKIRLIRPKAIG